MNILLCHHLEPRWAKGYATYDTNLEYLCNKITHWILQNPVDKVIISQFELNKSAQCDEAYFQLFQLIEEQQLILEWQEYGYGWDKHCLWKGAKKGKDYCLGGNHSQIVMLDPWIKALKGHQVYLAGAFRGECLEDIQIAMDALKINYKDIEELQVG